MARRKYSNSELQLEFNFQDDDSAADVKREVVPVERPIKELPVLPEEDDLEFFDKVDILLQQICEYSMVGDNRLNAFILRSFYLKGKGAAEIAKLLSKGIEGVSCVTRERVRMIVAEIRDELLLMPSSKKITKGIALRKEFVKEMVEYTANHIGYVVKESKWLASPRLGSIAFLLHMKVVTGGTIIPWIKTEKILLNENIEKRDFYTHYAALFYLLQKEVRPMAYEDILRGISGQKQMKGTDVREDLLPVILQHDEVFEETSAGFFQLRTEHLNVAQRIARIIFEEKEITPSDLQRMYEERYGGTFSGIAAAGRIYPWCVPVGKSKWVYREDGERLRMPTEVIHDFCKERVRFTLQDVLLHLESQGININESSVRCYILRDCRSLNADGKIFCLASEIPESENNLWRSKNAVSTHSRNREWKDNMARKIRSILELAPMHRMLQKDVLKQCRYILEHERIADNNFYKMVKSLTWLKSITIDGKTYLELNN